MMQLTGRRTRRGRAGFRGIVWLHRGLVVLSVSVAAGGSVAALMLADALWLRPLTIDEPEKVVLVRWRTAAGLGEQAPLQSASAMFAATRTVSSVGGELARSALLQEFQPHLTWGTSGAPVRATAVTSGYFDALGVRVRGPGFSVQDDAAGASASVVLSDTVWRARFGAATSAIGGLVDLGRVQARVVGVTEPGFRGARVGDHFEAWVSFGALPSAAAMPAEVLRLANVTVYARLRSGATAAEAAAELRQLLPRSAEIVTQPLNEVPYPLEQDALARSDRQMVWLLMCLSGAVLLIGCVNLLGLEALRSGVRRREMALRLALGATRARLMLATGREVVALGVAGGILAALIARSCLLWIGDFSLPSGVEVGTLRWNGGGYAFAAAAVVGIGMVSVRCIPAWTALRASPWSMLRLRSAASTTSNTGHGVVLSVHVAITMVLLTVAFLFARTVRTATSLDLGFARGEVVGVLVQPRVGQFAVEDDAQGARGRRARVAAFDDFLRQLRLLPGIVDATAGELPLGPLGFRPGSTAADGDVRTLGVGPRYAGTVGMTVKAGRDLADSDVGLEPRRVLVSEEFARRYWGGSAAVGRIFALDSIVTRPLGGTTTASQRRQVVGVVADALRRGFRLPPAPAIYEIRTEAEAGGSGLFVAAVVRTARAGESMAREVETVARRTYRDPVQLNVRSAASVMADEFRVQRLGAVLLGGISAVAVILAAVGVFGIVAVAVGARRREFAVRLALGASLRQVRFGAARIGIVPVAVGCAVGVAGSAIAGMALASYLFGVTPRDPATWSISIAALLLVATAASYWSASQTGQIDIVSELQRGAE